MQYSEANSPPYTTSTLYYTASHVHSLLVWVDTTTNQVVQISPDQEAVITVPDGTPTSQPQGEIP